MPGASARPWTTFASRTVNSDQLTELPDHGVERSGTSGPTRTGRNLGGGFRGLAVLSAWMPCVHTLCRRSRVGGAVAFPSAWQNGSSSVMRRYGRCPAERHGWSYWQDMFEHAGVDGAGAFQSSERSTRHGALAVARHRHTPAVMMPHGEYPYNISSGWSPAAIMRPMATHAG
jgi:hypothetical protein